MKKEIAALFTTIEKKATAFKTMQTEKMADKITQKMAKKFDLTDEQKTKVYQINLDMLNEKGPFKKEKGKSPKEVHNTMRESMKGEWFEFKNILTEDQLKKIKHIDKIDNKFK